MKLDTDTPLPFMTPAECPMLHKFSVKHTITVIKSRREQETCTIRQSKIVKTPFFTLSISIVSCLFISLNQQQGLSLFCRKSVQFSVQFSWCTAAAPLHWTERHFAKPNLVRDPCGAEGVRLQYFRLCPCKKYEINSKSCLKVIFEGKLLNIEKLLGYNPAEST